MTSEVGNTVLRKEFVDSMIKQIAKRAYKFKQAVAIITTDAERNYFYREDTTVLAGRTGNLIKGIPRGAAYPQRSVEVTKILSVVEKYGLEENIPWEDLLTNDVDMRNRTLIKIAEGVTKAVDDEIWEVLTESVPSTTGATVTNIQSVAIAANATGARYWDVASGAIIDDLTHCAQLIAQENYDTGNLMAFVSPKDYRSIMNYLADKGAQFPSVGAEIANNGKKGNVAGVQLIVSNSVTASYALVVVPKIVGTWKANVPLTTITKEDPLQSITIRCAERGVTQLTDPKAAVLIINTQNPA